MTSVSECVTLLTFRFDVTVKNVSLSFDRWADGLMWDVFQQKLRLNSFINCVRTRSGISFICFVKTTTLQPHTLVLLICISRIMNALLIYLLLPSDVIEITYNNVLEKMTRVRPMSHSSTTATLSGKILAALGHRRRCVKCLLHILSQLLMPSSCKLERILVYSR